MDETEVRQTEVDRIHDQQQLYSEDFFVLNSHFYTLNEQESSSRCDFLNLQVKSFQAMYNLSNFVK